MKGFFITIFILQLFTVLGQKTYKQSDSIEICKLNQLAFDKAYENPKEAISYANKALSLSKKKDFYFGEIRALLRIGIIYDVQDKDSLALKNINEALKISRRVYDSLGIASCHNNIGLIHWKQGELQKAIISLRKAYFIFEKINKLENLAFVSNNIGMLYEEIEAHKIAIEWYKKTLRINSKIKNGNNNNDVYTNIGYIYFNINQLDSAKYYLQKAINGHRKSNHLFGLAKALNNFGLLYQSKSNASQAIPYFIESIDISKKLNNTSIYISTVYNLSNVYSKIGSHAKTLQLLLEVSPLLDSVKNIELKFKVYRTLSLEYFRINDFKNGKIYHDRFMRSYEAYFKEKLNKNIIDSEKKYNLQNARKKMYIAENKRLLAEISSKKKTYLIFTVVVVFTVIFIIFLYINNIKKNRLKLQQQKAILIEKDKGLKAIVLAQENERIAIAKDLHEGIGNQLLALKLNLNKEIKDSRVNDLLNEILVDVRNVSHQMMPKVLQEYGFIEALKDLTHKIFTPLNITTNLEISVLENNRFEKEIELTLFRISQEIFNNIVKHAKASHVNIQLYEANEMLIYMVEDDGLGFDVETQKNGIGLHNMSSRIDLIKGKLEIESSKNQGTAICIRIPIKKEIYV